MVRHLRLLEFSLHDDLNRQNAGAEYKLPVSSYSDDGPMTKWHMKGRYIREELTSAGQRGHLSQVTGGRFQWRVADFYRDVCP